MLGQPGSIGELKEGAAQVINKNFQRIYNAFNKKETYSNWGFIQGDGTTQIEETVTFPITFNKAPLVTVTLLGAVNSSDPTAISQLTTALGAVGSNIYAVAITTTKFDVYLTATGNTFGATYRFGYYWEAKEIIT